VTATEVIRELEHLVEMYGDQEVMVYNGDPVDPAEIECEGVSCNRSPDGVITFEMV
jgi:hypothetical protein